MQTISAYPTASNFRSRWFFWVELLSLLSEKTVLVGTTWLFVDRGAASLLSWLIGLCFLATLIGSWLAERAPIESALRTWPITVGGIGLMVTAGLADALPPPVTIVLVLILATVIHLTSPISRSIHRTRGALAPCFGLSLILAPWLAAALFASVGLSGWLFVSGLTVMVATVLRFACGGDGGDESAPTVPSSSLKLNLFALNVLIVPLLLILPLLARHILSGWSGALATLQLTYGSGTLLGTLGLCLLQLPRPRPALGLMLGTAAEIRFFFDSPASTFALLFFAAFGLILTLGNFLLVGGWRSSRFELLTDRLNALSAVAFALLLTVVGILRGLN